MTRYNDGAYECDSEQEADWYEKEESAHCFVELSEDGNGGLKAIIRIYSDKHPTVMHKPGAHFFLFSHAGSDLGEAFKKCTASLVSMFPGLKVDHG